MLSLFFNADKNTVTHVDDAKLSHHLSASIFLQGCRFPSPRPKRPVMVLRDSIAQHPMGKKGKHAQKKPATRGEISKLYCTFVG